MDFVFFFDDDGSVASNFKPFGSFSVCHLLRYLYGFGAEVVEPRGQCPGKMVSDCAGSATVKTNSASWSTRSPEPYGLKIVNTKTFCYDNRGFTATEMDGMESRMMSKAPPEDPR
ncbi:UNVERIFIED_CONTAM: hypothetical protein PYX00_001662 [Menopon gallinae]|uniref:Uncharacterized protein n=1 Tax=Menopon gallinae TaxID=328185 RepID=A0AAW2IEM9_9NEOP